MLNAHKNFWLGYLDFTNKSSRSQFWFAWLINVIIATILSFTKSLPVQSIFSLLIFIPSLAILFRRLHDIGKTGMSILWIFLPVIGWIILLVELIQPSKK